MKILHVEHRNLDICFFSWDVHMCVTKLSNVCHAVSVCGTRSGRTKPRFPLRDDQPWCVRRRVASHARRAAVGLQVKSLVHDVCHTSFAARTIRTFVKLSDQLRHHHGQALLHDLLWRIRHRERQLCRFLCM